jgi:leucyl aminopeptidase
VPASLIEEPAFKKGEVLEAFLTGGFLGIYQFNALKTQRTEAWKTIQECMVIAQNHEEASVASQAITFSTIISRAVCVARDLVMLPPNQKTPAILAQKAKILARENQVQCRIITQAQAQKLGMGAFLAVARGSREPAKLIVLTYAGDKPHEAPLVLVGKGITFDSGGISLKTPKDMERMKDDMAGGAAVLGALQAAAQLKVPLNLVGIVPATENLPDGKAYKPGDVLTSMSGQSIEVVTTDAEGRLILADALTYAARFKPKAIVDLATLTGACVVALGDHVAGAMGNDDPLMARMREAGEKAGERVWQLPLWEEYAEYLKSEIADIKNAGGRPAGTITGGMFLSRFVSKTPWVHLDIAGPAWSEKARPYIPKGASGFGVRLLIQLLRDWKTNAS